MGNVRLGIAARKDRRINCATCKTTDAVNPECIDCCVKWMNTMLAETNDPAYLTVNAPTIKFAVSEEHLNDVREAWKTKGA